MYLIILQLPFVNKLRYEDYFQNKLVRSHIAHWAKLTLTVIKAGWWKSKLIQKYLKNSVNYTCLSLLEIFFKKNSHLLSFGSRCCFMGCCFNNYKLKSISHFPSVFSAFVSPFSDIERLTCYKSTYVKSTSLLILTWPYMETVTSPILKASCR